MPLFGNAHVPIIKRTYVSSSYATGSSGRLITLTLSSSNAVETEEVSWDATSALMFELGQELVTGSAANASITDPLGTILWTYQNVSSSSGVLNGYESRIDIASSLNEYRVYLTGSDDRKTFGYHMMGQTADLSTGSAGDTLADYIIAQWSAESVSVTSTSIDTLIDEQTGGYDLTAAGSARATYDATGGPNSEPCISFDGTNDIYQLNGITRDQPHAIVITGEFITDNRTITDGYAEYTYHVAISYNMQIYTNGAGGSTGTGDQDYSDGWHTWIFYFNGNSSTITRDNVLQATGGGGSPGTDDGVGITLGGGYNVADFMQMNILRVTLVDATDFANAQAVSDQHATDFGTYTP